MPRYVTYILYLIFNSALPNAYAFSSVTESISMPDRKIVYHISVYNFKCHQIVAAFFNRFHKMRINCYFYPTDVNTSNPFLSFKQIIPFKFL